MERRRLKRKRRGGMGGRRRAGGSVADSLVMIGEEIEERGAAWEVRACGCGFFWTFGGLGPGIVQNQELCGRYIWA